MFATIANLLKPAPDARRIADSDEVARQYRYWRFRILYASIIGYALFYIVRKNLSVAMPAMEKALGISKSQLGMFLTFHGLLYGVSKFANGFLGDRTNPRYFMAVGLGCSAVMSLCFGLSSGVMAFGWFWLFNGWFQGMGFPPCARSLTHWFAPGERGTRFAIWNTSHSIGAVIALLLCGFLVTYGWRLCFLAPAGLGLAGALFLVNRLRDTPQSLGLPPVEERAAGRGDADDVEDANDDIASMSFVVRYVFLNPMIWLLSLANVFVYTIRYTFLDWGPTFLSETKGIRLEHTVWFVAAYEVTGSVGMLLSGWLTDKVFKGRGGRACFVYMLLCGVCIYLYTRIPAGSLGLSLLLLCAIGFFIYGPQCLVGMMAANLATKRAAATAIGVTGFFGYLSTALSGWGLGWIVQHHGWGPGFQVLIGAAVVATALFALSWNARRAPRHAQTEPAAQ